MGNQGSLMIIPRGRVMVPGFHVMKFDANQDGLQVRGQVILDITSRSQERTDCNLCGVVNMDLETYTFHKKTQFHMENLGDHLLCHEEEEDARFVTPMGKCPPRSPPAPRKVRETEEEVRDYPIVSLNHERRELIDVEEEVPFSLSQELDDASVPMEMTGPASVPMEMITKANAEEVKDILRRAFITDFFRNIRAQGNNGQNRSVLIQRATETWHQHFSQYLASENKKKLEFLIHCVFKEAGKDFRFNKIDIICKSLNYVIPTNGVLLAFQRNEEFDEDVSTRKALVSEKDFASATPSQEETPHADMELFIVDDDEDTIIDDEVIPEAVVADPVIPEAVLVIPEAVVDVPVIPKALAEQLITEKPQAIMVIHVKGDLSAQIAKAGKKLVVVDYSAVWCGPCQSIKSFYVSLAKKYLDVVFLEVDEADNKNEIAARGVRGFPTFQFYLNGKQVDEFSCANPSKLEVTVTNWMLKVYDNSKGVATSSKMVCDGDVCYILTDDKMDTEIDVAEQLLAVSEQLPVVTEPEYEDEVEVLPVMTEVIDAVEDYEEVEVLPAVTEVIDAVEPEYEDYEKLPVVVTEVIDAVEPEYEDYEEEVKEGHHEYYYSDGVKYTGNYVNNERSGYGECEFVSKKDGIYKGYWSRDKQSGQGVMKWYTGDVYIGEWKCKDNKRNTESQPDGKGKMTYKTGQSYEGDFIDGWRHGQGFYRFKTHKRIKGDQRVSYEGEWKNNIQDGFGKLTWSDGTVEEGFWVAGVKSKKRKAPSSVAPEVAPAWKIVKIKGDGNCTFRALAYLIYGDECYHLLLRRICYETIFAEGNQFLLEDEEKDNWTKFGNEGGDVAIETISRLYGCQVNVIDSRKKSMSGNGPYNANENHPVLTLVYSIGHYDAFSNGVFDFKSAVFSAKDRETVGSFENRILQAKGGQIIPDQVLLSGSLQYDNSEYDILDVVYARENWMTLPSKTLTLDNDTTKKPQQAHQYLYYYKIGNEKWISGLLATEVVEQAKYIKRMRKTCCECDASKSFKWHVGSNDKYYCEGCF